MKTAKLMSIGAILVAVCLAGGIAGCQDTTKVATKCPSCEMKMDAGAYCAKCNAVAAEGTVACKVCKKGFKAGEYCGKCKKFMLAGDAACAGCDAKGAAGSFCAKCNTYKGVKGSAHCTKCNKPVDKAAGCPACNKADVEGPMQ
jgi:hypothetical protein